MFSFKRPFFVFLSFFLFSCTGHPNNKKNASSTKASKSKPHLKVKETPVVFENGKYSFHYASLQEKIKTYQGKHRIKYLKFFFVAFSKKQDKVIAKFDLTNKKTDHPYKGPDNCFLKKDKWVFKSGYFDEKAVFHPVNLQFYFDPKKEKFFPLSETEAQKIKCNIDCTKDSNKDFSYCILQRPCKDQWPPEVSTMECNRSYFCPPPKKIIEGKTHIALWMEGRYFGAVYIKVSTFSETDPNALRAYPEVFRQDSKLDFLAKPIPPAYSRTTCFYDYETSSKDSFLSTSNNSKKHFLNLKKITEEEKNKFNKFNEECKAFDKENPEFQDYPVCTLKAVSDINKDGKNEYWYFASGESYEEHKFMSYNIETNKWEIIVLDSFSTI